MPRIKIEGNNKLSGKITISGAKNSAVALIPAAILCDEEVILENVPNITDVDDLENILCSLKSNVIRNGDVVIINNNNLENNKITHELSKKLRASYYFMGALLGKFKYVDMYFPGGCSIGARPINIHLKGFEALGADIIEEDNHFIIKADDLVGNKIDLDFPSVGATINIMLAATKARGVTVINNAAREPEIVNVALFLNEMGAMISGAGTDTITIQGVKYLHSAVHKVIPDRIEAGTYLIIASLLGENLTIDNLDPIHLKCLTDLLIKSGVNMDINDTSIVINNVGNYKSFDVETNVYPGFPTDLQQVVTTFLTQCDGEAKIVENIYENRFQNVEYLNKMGANIIVSDNNKEAIVKGKTKLIGKEVKATDLRGGASLLIAGLIADGITYISDISYILRGYDNIVEKLQNVGAKIELI